MNNMITHEPPVAVTDTVEVALQAAPRKGERMPEGTLEDICLLYKEGRPLHEIAFMVSLTSVQVDRLLGRLLRTGQVQYTPVRYEAVRARTLPKEIQRQLGCSDEALVRVETDPGQNLSGTVRVVLTRM